MKTSTAFNHYTRFRSALDAIYSTAKCAASPHAKILDQITERIYKDPAWHKCPAWVRTAIGERSHLHLQYLHRDAVLWAFPDAGDGMQIRVYEQLTPEGREAVHRQEIQGGHYYLRPVYSGGATCQVDGTKVTREYLLTDRAL